MSDASTNAPSLDWLINEFPGLMTREFDSSEIGMLSGISPERQRTYRHRGLIPFSGISNGSFSANVHEAFKWMITGEVTRIGIEVACAANFADVLATKVPVDRVDFRSQGGAPLLVYSVNVNGTPESFRNVNTKVGPSEQYDGIGRVGLWIDYSQLQKLFLDRLRAL